MSAQVIPQQTAQQSLAFLWRGRWVVLLCAVIAGAMGVFAAERRGETRRAKSTLAVERESVDARSSAFSRGEARNYAASQAELLRSAPTLLAAVQSVGDRAELAFEGKRDRIGFLASHLAVKAGADDGLVTVALESSQCESACILVNAIVDAYVERAAAERRGERDAAMRALRIEIANCEAAAAEEAAERAALLASRPDLSVSAEARRGLVATRLAELGAVLAQAEAAELIADSQRRDATARIDLASAENVLATPGIEEASSRRLMELLMRQRDAQTQLRALATQVTEEHPSLLRSRREVEEAQAAAANEAREIATAFAAAADARRLAAQRTAGDLRARMLREEGLLAVDEPGAARLRALDEKAARIRVDLHALRERMRVASLDAAANRETQGARQAGAVVFERAHPDTSPVVRSKSSLIAMAVAAGFAIGIAGVWLTAFARPVVCGASDLSAIGPCVAEFPSVGASRSAMVDYGSQPDAAGASIAVALSLSGGSGKDAVFSCCVSGDDRESAAIAHAVAVAFARQGLRALLVDPFGLMKGCSEPTPVARMPGMRERGPVPIVSLASPSSRVTGLWIATNVDALHPDARALGSAFAQSITASRERFDRIVVLCPSVLTTAEAAYCARACEATLLVVRQGRTRVADVVRAIAALAAAGARIHGTLLSGVPRRRIARSIAVASATSAAETIASKSTDRRDAKAMEASA